MHYAQVNDRETLLTSIQPVQIQPFKTEFNLCWTSQFHNIRSWLITDHILHWSVPLITTNYHFQIFKIPQLAVLNISLIWHFLQSTGGPHSQSRHLRKVKNLLALLGINSQLKFHESSQKALNLFYISSQPDGNQCSTQMIMHWSTCSESCKIAESHSRTA